MAAAGIPQINNLNDGNVMIGAGIGLYGGESAVAIGVSGVNDNRDRTYKISTTYDSTGCWGLSGGIGFAVGSGDNRRPAARVVDMTKRMNALEAANKQLNESNDKLQQTNEKLQQEVDELKAMMQEVMKKVK